MIPAYAFGLEQLHGTLLWPRLSLTVRVYKRWQEHSKNLAPGEEYRLVDEFADMVGLRG
jgi:hypothetical protein